MSDALAKVGGMSRDEMSVIERIHGGAGSIWFTELFGADDFATPWRFIHYAILPPGEGIGHHGHEDSEEVFVTLDNAAQLTHNGRTTETVGGTTVPLRAGETHAIYNHTDRDTHFLNFHVVDPKGEPRVVE